MFAEMRRQDRLLSQEETVQILERGEYGVLSMYDTSGYPYGVPVNCVYEDGKLYIHCARSAGLDELAEALSLTPARASEAVRKLFGSSFCALLREKRLEKAKLLLRNSAFTIDSVARRCGYRDGAYFHRVFRKAAGVTPLRYRLENRAGEA